MSTRESSLPFGMRPEVARRRIEVFYRRFGVAHLYLAFHAAFPIALTPDLIHRLRATFQRDAYGKLLNIPWIAVADLLLSSLCEEVGYELYEMNVAVRNELLSQLRQHVNFGEIRITELSNFLLNYVRQQLNSHDPDTREFAYAQYWTALVATRPEEAAHSIALTLSKLDPRDRAGFARMKSLIETLGEPSDEFATLFAYTKSMEQYARGNEKQARIELDTASSKTTKRGLSVDVRGVGLPIPRDLWSPVKETGEPGPPQTPLMSEQAPPVPPLQKPVQGIEIFIVYTRKDKKWRDELERYLTPLQHQGMISSWNSCQINPRVTWKGEIDKPFNTAQIILLLMSAEFMASDFCYSTEMKQALQRHDVGECRVIPLILRPVHWKEEPFSILQALPANGRAITAWRSKDKAFTEIMEGLQAVIAELRKIPDTPQFDKMADYERTSLSADPPALPLLEKTIVVSPPENLEARVREGVVSLEWHQSSTQAPSLLYSIVRKSHTQPDSLQDGQILETVSGFTYEDTHPDIGVPLYYAVYTRYDQLVSRQPARLAQPIFLALEVSGLTAYVNDQQVTLNWEPPPGAYSIIILRNDRAIPTSAQDGVQVAEYPPDRNSFIDREVQNGHTYYYGIFCQFKNPAEQSVLSPGLHVAAMPDLPPSPIDSFTLTSTETERGLEVLIRWKRPNRGNAAIIKSTKRLPLSPWQVIPESSISTLGQKLEQFPDSVTDIWTKAGAAYYTSVILFQGMAYIGASERFAWLDNVTQLQHQNIGSAIRFHWKWPNNCQEVLISYSLHDWPEHDDPTATTLRVNISQYEKLGYFDLVGTLNQNYYIVVSALINQDGAQIPAEGIRIYTRIGPIPTFSYEIKNPTRFRRKPSLHLYFTDRTGWTIPRLLLISKQDGIPFTKTDGDIFLRLDPFLISTGQKEKVIPLPERSLPPKTFGKLFLEDDMMSGMVKITHPAQEKLRLNTQD